jgi:hypothetical protein
MINKIIKKLFSKTYADNSMYLPKEEVAKFTLKVDGIDLGNLSCKDGVWEFHYTDAFKMHNEYNRIVGFPDLDKNYHSNTLWPFFRVRIPGLKQPAIKEIISNEHINANNEVELLKRFGRKTISNPYELFPVA